MRRQLILFLAAILLPSVVLIALAVHLVIQNRQDRGTRRAREIAGTAGQELLKRLEAIGRDEVRGPLPAVGRYRNPETALVAWIEGDRLLLPWDEEQAARKTRDPIFRPEFRDRIRPCEEADYSARNSNGAVDCYRKAAEEAADAVQKAYAQLEWARALDRAKREAEALPKFRDLLRAPPEAGDEDGVPVRLFAAQRLLESDPDVPAALGAAIAVMKARPWLPPAACRIADEIANRVGDRATNSEQAEQVRRLASAHFRLVEQGQAMESDFARTGLASRRSGLWVTYGDERWPWLVGVESRDGERAAVVAVWAADVFRGVGSRLGVKFETAADAGGEPAGEKLPRLRVALGSGAAGGAGFPGWVIYASLGMLAGATLFVAWLLGRDLRRELRVSELRSQFVSSVSHELKTPLTSIRMLAETLQMGRGRDAKTESEYLDTIVNECERLSRLVDGVLLFSKAERGKVVYHFRPLEAAETVHAAARALDYTLAQKGFRLKIEIEAGLPRLRGDHDALEQALLNLLGNAMKYSGDARDIEVAVKREDGRVAIDVTDHGAGIAAAEQTRIFEKFYRADTPENQHIPGTGLGLALVAQIVKAHGGEVRVRSAPGEGSTFSLLLPLEEKS
jgi:Osmosensitive K+ channel histidine kinase